MSRDLFPYSIVVFRHEIQSKTYTKNEWERFLLWFVIYGLNFPIKKLAIEHGINFVADLLDFLKKSIIT